VSRRTSAEQPSGALPTWTVKRKMRSASRGRASNLIHDVVNTHEQILGSDALERMYVASRSKFVRIAYSILRNGEDAEDAVHSAFLSAYQHLPSFEGRSALTTWFTRIVLNAALMIHRRRKSSGIRPLSETTDSHTIEWTECIPSGQPDPETVYSERETLDLINGILEKMKPKLRQAFAMTYFDELSGPEACRLLGISPSNFKARLFRARGDLLNKAQRALRPPS
jgi:RNA polymerase sigma-70 factor (ECF subfamily)